LAADGADRAVPRFEAAYAAQTRGFARAILDDRPVDVPGPVGAAALAIALTAGRSMREGRPVAV
jgi:predicted dehydrogenase